MSVLVDGATVLEEGLVTFDLEKWLVAHGPPRVGESFPTDSGDMVRLVNEPEPGVFGYTVFGTVAGFTPAPQPKPPLGSGFAKNEFVPMVGRNFTQRVPGVFQRRKGAA